MASTRASCSASAAGAAAATAASSMKEAYSAATLPRSEEGSCPSCCVARSSMMARTAAWASSARSTKLPAELLSASIGVLAR